MNRFSIVALFAVATALAACGKKQQPAATADAAKPSTATSLDLPPNQRARVRSEVVTAMPYGVAIETTGTVAFDGDQSTSVLAPISGPVTRILVQPGANVSRGEVLAYVSSPDFAEAIANFRKAVAAQRNAKRVADLDEQLFKNDAIARRDLEQAQTDAVAAQADLDAAVQQLRALGVDPNDAASSGNQLVEGVIRAPISGTLVERLISPGQLIQAGETACFTIADLSKVWVMANIFSSDLARVERGDKAEITTSASPSTFTGVVDYIAALVDPGTKATAVRIVVPNPSHFLRRDMYVNVAIHSRQQQTGLLIPVSAVLRDDDNQPFVFVDMGNGHYERRDVQLGSRMAEQYPVAAGLKAGDRIVSEGGLFLQFAESQ